jgi:hypothetical protein
MKHLKTFESFSVNEELLGLPSINEMKAKAQAWLQQNKNNPELQKAIAKVKMEMEKLDPSTQDKLKELSTETPEEIKPEIEQALKESMINEGMDWKTGLSKVFKFLGIGTVGVGFITTFWSIITMTITGTGYTKMLGGMEAGNMDAVGMGIMLAAIIPMIISTTLTPEAE